MTKYVSSLSLLSSAGLLIVGSMGYLYGSAYTGLSLFLLFLAIILNRTNDSGSSSANTGVWYNSISNKGHLAWIAAFVLTSFYVIIYWFPSVLGYQKEGNTGLIKFFDPLSYVLNGHAASQWFVYGCFYTLLILAFGINFIVKYRHNNYQIIRTLSLMFFQLFFAFLIPEILNKLNPDLDYFAKDLKNMWPLNYYMFEDWHLNALMNGKSLGLFFLVWALVLIFIVSPILTYHFGKRWYCSWVCGCGGLAETAGDSFRQLSDKSAKAWKYEKYIIYSVLVFVSIITISQLGHYLVNHHGTLYFRIFLSLIILFSTAIFYFILTKGKNIFESKELKLIKIIAIIFLCSMLLALAFSNPNLFFIDAFMLKGWYGFFIGAAFSGVIGVGFYPIMGSRVWCRFGCPMAAILGIQQKLFSKFRISTNGSQCISCGNCSTFCEMGIDVRSYAEQGKDISRSSCVGCGICAEVCPRGVLKLENGKIML